MENFATDMMHFRRIKTDLLDSIDRIKNNNGYNIRRTDADIAKCKINKAFQIVSGIREESHKKLSAKDLSKVINMISDLGSGKKEVIQFQVTEDEEGIRELFTGQIFKFG
jgi:hypothetical protein